MAYVIGQELFRFAGINTSGQNTHSVSERLTVRVFYGASIKQNSAVKGDYSLSVKLYIDDADNFVGEHSSSNPGLSIEGSVAFDMVPNRRYKIWAVQTNNNATADSTWVRGSVSVTS
jgi:hypothetical protein